MTRPQQVLAIDHRLAGKQGEGLGRHLDDALAFESRGRDVIAGQLAIGRLVLAQREQLVKTGVANVLLPTAEARRIFLSRAASSREGLTGSMSRRPPPRAPQDEVCL